MTYWLNKPVADQGAFPPPLFLDQTEAQRPKKFWGGPGPPSEGLDLPLYAPRIFICTVTTGLENTFNPAPLFTHKLSILIFIHFFKELVERVW